MGEEIVVYPVLEKAVPGGKALADKDRAQHQVAKNDIYELQKKSTSDDDFDPLIAKIMRELREHIKEEEEQDLPKLRSALSEDEGRKLGKEFQMTKMFVPTQYVYMDCLDPW